MDYSKTVDYLLALPDGERFSGRQGQTMSLECMKELLRLLDNPHKQRKTIHVTGSKGKGSTSKFLAQILQQSGYSTALFTSPHLCDYTERICLGGKAVSRAAFTAGVERIRPAIEKVQRGTLAPVSTFGALTALFFDLCRNDQTDWQVVEVGLGGSSDATNIFETKELSIITAISLEHTAILGETVSEIAAQKAEIITAGSNTILARQKDRSVLPVISRRCRQVSSHLVDVNKLYHWQSLPSEPSRQTFSVTGGRDEYILETSLLGPHQLDNAAAAIAAAEELMTRGHHITKDSLATGIASATLPGRLEILLREPVLVIDAAHNPESFAALAKAIAKHFDYKRCIFIVGANSDKKIAEMLYELAPLSPELLIATASANPKALPPPAVAAAARRCGLSTVTLPDIGTSIDHALSSAQSGDLVCVTGSFYIAGEARSHVTLAKSAIANP